MTMRDILLLQHRRYPEMKLQDMVKLIYQNEFAGGHLISDEKSSLEMLREECRSLEACSTQAKAGPVYEKIGNGLARLHLSGALQKGLELSTVNRFFVRTANSAKGNTHGLEKKLEALKDCCREGELPYSVEVADAYLKPYKRQGYPPVSHSASYKTAYAPAYRIVKSAYADYLDVFEKTDALLRTRDTVIVAIDGMSSAGKSSLADLMASVYDCNVLHMDDFFLPPNLKTPERLQEAGGNVDYDRFLKEVLLPLRQGGPFSFQVYDCGRQALGKRIDIAPKKLSVVEGSYSMHPLLREHYDLKVFLSVPEEEQSRRILERNGPVMHQRFMREWVPLENRYFSEMNIKSLCDLAFEG